MRLTHQSAQNIRKQENDRLELSAAPLIKWQGGRQNFGKATLTVSWDDKGGVLCPGVWLVSA